MFDKEVSISAPAKVNPIALLFCIESLSRGHECGSVITPLSPPSSFLATPQLQFESKHSPWNGYPRGNLDYPQETRLVESLVAWDPPSLPLATFGAS